MRKKIVLLFPNFKLFEKFTITPHQPSLSLGYLAGMLKEKGIDFAVIDARAENLSIEKLLKRIERYNPEYVGLTVNIAFSYAAIYTSLKIKHRFPKIKTIMGGPWATAEYEIIIKKKYADYVILGEGEYSMLELLEANNDYSKLEKVIGLAYSEQGNVKNTGRRPFITDLDALPFPPWEYFPRKGYYKSVRIKPAYPLTTTRGCPFNCLNCTKIVHGHKLRKRSIPNILKEIEYLKSIGCKEIIIEDDMFNYDLGRLKELLREIIKGKFNMKFQLSNGIRADFIDQELAYLFYAAGVYRVAIGIESGSQAVVNFLQKRLDLKVVPKAVDQLKKANLKVSGYFILGLPIENYQSLIHTVDFADNLDLDLIVFLNFLAFPGTQIRDYVEKNYDLEKEKASISPISNYVYTPLYYKTEQLNQRILKKVKAYYLIRTFTNFKRIRKFIETFTIQEFIFQAWKQFKTAVSQFLMPKIAKSE